MREVNGKHIIQSLQRKWNRQLLVAHLLFAVAATIFLFAVAVKTVGVNWIIFGMMAILFLVVMYVLYLKKIGEQDVARFLNYTFPQLQESTHLFLQPYDSLNGLEKLQLNKVAQALNENIPVPPSIKKRFTTAVFLLLAALLLAVMLFFIPVQPVHSSSTNTTSGPAVNTRKPERKLAVIKQVTITITPPSYTGSKQRTQDVFNLVAEQKAAVAWDITTTQRAAEVTFVFNDKSVLKLKPANKEGTQWTAGTTIRQPGFYQVSIDKQLSELYKIEMIRDEAPVITVQSPKPNTLVDFGEPKKVVVKVSVADDYGIAAASLQATTASGSGEAVKFKEVQLPFSGFSRGRQQNQLQKVLDLPALGMQAGDELYFYIKAKDNNNQEKRSDVYIVRLADTAQLMSMSGLVSGVDVKPEFFRSERQIIIETEQLLKDKDTMSVEDFNKKSSDLGIDQKLLRLRYGKFLGEENETDIGGDHDHAEGEHHEASTFGNEKEIIDQYSHKHDIAEDATFFDDATKKQLKATLDEMWKAELQLRTYQPQAALPFEYKALRLLKDLQQKTRSYVAKTGVKTTPLSPGKRLTGELGSITQPVTTATAKQKDSSLLVLRKAIGILEGLRSGEPVQLANMEIVAQAGTQLSAKAASNPAVYLPAYGALIRILEKSEKSGDIDLAGKAFQKMIQSIAGTPQQSGTAPDMHLSQYYFMNLKRQHD